MCLTCFYVFVQNFEYYFPANETKQARTLSFRLFYGHFGGASVLL